MQQKSDRDWPEWLGGLVMVAATIAPPTILSIAAADHPWVGRDVAGAAALLVSLLVLASIAPLVGRSRRYVVWSLVPVWGIVIAYRFGVDLARLSSVAASRGPTSERDFQSSREQA